MLNVKCIGWCLSFSTFAQFYYNTHEMGSALTEELGFQTPVGARDFSSLQNVQTGSRAHPSSYSKVTERSPEFSHTYTSSAGVKNEWSSNSTPPTCSHGAERNFTFFLIHHLGEVVTVRMPSILFLQKLLNECWWILIFDL